VFSTLVLSVENTKSVLKTSISRTKDGKKSESYPQKLALTSPTSSGRSVGIVR
jgi:hypothetical protein